MSIWWMTTYTSKATAIPLRLAAIATIACLLIGFPMAYAIARAQKTTRNILLLLVILPFWTSFFCAFMRG